MTADQLRELIETAGRAKEDNETPQASGWPPHSALIDLDTIAALARVALAATQLRESLHRGEPAIDRVPFGDELDAALAALREVP